MHNIPNNGKDSKLRSHPHLKQNTTLVY